MLDKLLKLAEKYEKKSLLPQVGEKISAEVIDIKEEDGNVLIYTIQLGEEFNKDKRKLFFIQSDD